MPTGQDNSQHAPLPHASRAPATGSDSHAGRDAGSPPGSATNGTRGDNVQALARRAQHAQRSTTTPASAGSAAPNATRVDRVRELAARLPSRPSAIPPAKAAVVSLLETDPDLADAIPPADRDRARRALSSPARQYAPGPMQLLGEAFTPTTFAILITEGALTQRVGIGGREMIELLVAQDIVLPWPPATPRSETDVQLAALEDLQLVGLDHRFTRAAMVWPQLMVTVHSRLADQRHRLATQGAICQLSRADQRLMAIMWHLATRIGKVTNDGTVVPWPRTHQALANLVGARRPTISLALKALHARGLLHTRSDGSWLLPRIPVDVPFETFIATLPEP